MAESKTAAGGKKKVATKKKSTKKKSAAVSVGATKTDNKVKADADSVSESIEASTPNGGSPASTIVPGAQAGMGTSTGSTGVAWFALLLSIVAMGAGGYAWYLTAVDSKLNMGQSQNRYEMMSQRVSGFELQQSDLSVQIAQLKTRLSQADNDVAERIRSIRNELEHQQAAVSEQIQASTDAMRAQVDSFQSNFSTLTDSIEIMRAQLGKSLDSWTIEEVEQLLFVAQLRMEFSGETDLAIKALQLADARLEQIADPALLELRKQIAVDIAALESVVKEDTVGLLNSLTLLSEEVSKLPLTGDFSAEGAGSDSPASSDSAEPTASQSDQGAFDSIVQPVSDAAVSFMESLGDLIQVEKNGKSVKPVVSDHVRQLTYERARLYLEAAQIAYVRKDGVLYENRIQSVYRWVEQNFDTESADTAQWLGQLSEIPSSYTVPVNPDIAGSLEALRRVMDARL